MRLQSAVDKRVKALHIDLAVEHSEFEVRDPGIALRCLPIKPTALLNVGARLLKYMQQI